MLIAASFMMVALSGACTAATPATVHPSGAVRGACWFGTAKQPYCGVRTDRACHAKHARDLINFREGLDCHGMPLKAH